jgi:uncharacterized protein YlxP (DUF503 family)
VKLRLPENGSLKGKRQVSRSIIERVKNRFNVSIAEVEDQDRWQSLTLGISCVSNSAPHANEILSKAVNFIENTRLDAELIDYEIEIINAL